MRIVRVGDLLRNSFAGFARKSRIMEVGAELENLARKVARRSRQFPAPRSRHFQNVVNGWRAH